MTAQVITINGKRFKAIGVGNTEVNRYEIYNANTDEYLGPADTLEAITQYL